MNLINLMKNLLESKIKSKIMYEGRLIHVKQDEVYLPNGEKGIREYIKHPGAVCCVPILDDGRIVLIRQFRYTIKKEIIEVPAGKIDDDETPIDAAERELEEEIGFKAKNLILLNKIYPAVGFANEEMWIYLTKNLEKSLKKPDEDEFIQIMPVDFENALEMIWSGQIRDAKTIIALLWADRFLKDN